MHRFLACVALLALGSLAACERPEQVSPLPSGTASGPPQSPREYTDTALDLLAGGLDVQANFPDLRVVALQRVEKATSAGQTYTAIRDVAAAVDQDRADLVSPGDAAMVGATTTRPSTQTAAGITVLTLPGFVDPAARPGSGAVTEAEQAYVRGGSAAVSNAARQTTCGWVVDVRGNTTTDLPVLVGSVASLLPEGRALVEVDRDGRTREVSLTDIAFVVDGSAVLSLDPVRRRTEPVAVLQDSGTTRAGEAVVLAFRGRSRTHFVGEPTFGTPTDGTVETLSDGATLYVSRWRLGDRSGEVARGPIVPDETVAESAPQLAAALDWVQDQCG